MVGEETFFSRNGFLKMRRLFLLAFIIEMGIYFVVSSIPYSNPALVSSLKSAQDTVAGLSLVGMIFYIFPHNLLIATLEFIPVAGQALFVLSTIQTPLALSASAYSVGIPGILAFVSLLLVPDTLIEVSAYALATATSIYMFQILVKSRTEFGAKVWKFIYMYLLTVLVLFIAGTFESVAIKFSLTENYPNNAIYPLMLWIPAIPVIYLLIRLFRHINRDEYQKAPEPLPDIMDFR